MTPRPKSSVSNRVCVYTLWKFTRSRSSMGVSTNSRTSNTVAKDRAGIPIQNMSSASRPIWPAGKNPAVRCPCEGEITFTRASAGMAPRRITSSA